MNIDELKAENEKLQARISELESAIREYRDAQRNVGCKAGCLRDEFEIARTMAFAAEDKLFSIVGE